MSKFTFKQMICIFIQFLTLALPLSIMARVAPSVPASPDVKSALGVRRFGLASVTNYSAWVGRKVKYTTVYLQWEKGQPGLLSEKFINMTADGNICSGRAGSEPLTVIFSMPMVPHGLPTPAKNGTGSTAANFNRALSGEWDAQYRAIGARIAERNLGTPWPDGRPKLILRLGWEQSGDWYPWSSIGAESEYKACWRHIVTTVEQAAGTSVVWEFNCSGGKGERSQVTKAYPGDDVVDIFGVDFYDGAYPSVPTFAAATRTEAVVDQKWISVVNGAGAGATKGDAGLQWYADFARSHGKKMNLSEFGLRTIRQSSTSYVGGGDDLFFVQNVFCWYSNLAKAGQLVAMNYFESGPDGDWSKLSPGYDDNLITVPTGVTTGSIYPKAAAKFIALFGGSLGHGTSVPTVSLDSPGSGSRYFAPATIPLSANVTGAVLQVDFYNGGSLLGTVRQAPYTLALKGVKIGNYSITARVTDSYGNVAESSPVNVTVVANTPPSVSITSPVNATSLPASSDVLITVKATDTTGSITKVEFYNKSTLIGTSTNSPYFMIWKNVPVGNYSLRAKATDEGKMTGFSAYVNVYVKASSGNAAPTVSVTSPANGATFTAPAKVTINASASDANGITQVGFYQGSTLLGTDTTAPYSFSWSNVPAGAYSITAKAVDTKGTIKFSKPANITVNASVSNQSPSISISTTSTTLMAPGTATIIANATDSDGSISKVEYYNGGSLIATDTASPYSTTLTGLAVGTYSITAKATDNRGASTTSSAITLNVLNTPPAVSMTAPVNGKSFTAPATVTMSANASDPNGSIARVEFYRGTTLLGTDTASPFSFTWKNVPVGNYTIVAKAIDNDGAATTSTAIGISVKTVVVNTPPSVSINASAEAIFTAPATVTIHATASDSDGSVSLVEFYNGTTLIGTDATSPYSATLTGLATGSYTLTAKATDNEGAVTTSAPVGITVTEPVPAAPDGLKVLYTSSFRIRMSWVNHADNQTGFKIERKTGVSGSYAVVATPTANETIFIHTGLKPETQYFYRVCATNASGDSEYSEEISSTTLPMAPIISSADAITSDVATAISYSITASGSPTRFAASGLPAGLTLDSVSGILSGTVNSAGTYPVTLSATNAGGTGTQVLTITIQPVSLGAPTNLTTTLSGTTVSLSWSDNSTDETSFRVWRKEGVTGTWAYYATVKGLSSYDDTKALSGKTYFYRVRVRKSEAADAVFSPWTSEVSVTLP